MAKGKHNIKIAKRINFIAKKWREKASRLLIEDKAGTFASGTSPTICVVVWFPGGGVDVDVLLSATRVGVSMIVSGTLEALGTASLCQDEEWVGEG